MFSVSEAFFMSGGLRCAADLYWPDAACGPVPCVVMGHGASGTKRLGLPLYAGGFASRGMAVLVFDYRYFGASEGAPRQVIGVDAQREDYRAAVAYARSCPGVDPARIGLWGTSLSGGHVLAVAADDSGIAAVVSQVPFIDGYHRGRGLLERLNRDVMARTVRFTSAAMRDVLRKWRGRPPLLVPVIAAPGKVAVFTESGAKAAFDALGGERTGWVNALAPRFLFALPRYRKGTADRLVMPLLMCLADRDQQASSRFAAKVAAQAPIVEIRHYPIGHFEAYVGTAFEQIARREADFLQVTLGSGSIQATPT